MPILKRGDLAHVDIFGDWLTYKNRQIVWLPPVCRVKARWILHDNVYTWVDEHGTLHSVEFDTSIMSEAAD